MPAPMPSFSDIGMAFTSHSRMRSRLMMRNSTPERNTAPSATCHDRPMPFTTVKVK